MRITPRSELSLGGTYGLFGSFITGKAREGAVGHDLSQG